MSVSNMSLDKLVSHLLVMAEREYNRDKAKTIHNFSFERKARDIIGPATARGKHHREREKHWTEELEAKEKKLREEGVSVEVWDPSQGYSLQTGSLVSGNIGGANQNFQPKIDQRMLDDVKHAKNKMLEHRGLAEKYEKYAKAFSCAPDVVLELTVEDVYFFRLEG